MKYFTVRFKLLNSEDIINREVKAESRKDAYSKFKKSFPYSFVLEIYEKV